MTDKFDPRPALMQGSYIRKIDIPKCRICGSSSSYEILNARGSFMYGVCDKHSESEILNIMCFSLTRSFYCYPRFKDRPKGKYLARFGTKAGAVTTNNYYPSWLKNLMKQRGKLYNTKRS